MKINEIFKIGDIMESVDGRVPYLDRDNCQIINKTKNDDSVILYLKRNSDGEEGRAYLRVQDKFKNMAGKILNLAFVNEKMIGLTLNQLGDLEMGVEI